MSRRTLIAACPPIPIEDLTVDQLAGPYLEADIYKRYLAQTGTHAQYVLTTDDTHSLVDVTARECLTEPEALVAPARQAIEASLRAYAIQVDSFGKRDVGYEPFLRSVFGKLYEAGALEVRDVPVLYEPKTHGYPADAWVRGSCPACLDEASGGVCETCGAPNGSVDLLALDPRRYALRTRRRLVLDLERVRPELEQQFGAMCAPRPALARLIRETLSRPLVPAVLSGEGGRGIPLDFVGLPEQRLHASAETFAAQRYSLEAVAGPLHAADVLVRFSGFGDAYTQGFVHGALAAAAVRCGLVLPLTAALVTSHLRRVRSGRGARSVVWARELTDVYGVDAVRLYLASIGPDYAEAHFVRSVVDSSIASMAESIDRLVQLWNLQRHSADAGRAQYEPRDIVGCMQKTLPLADFTSAELARRALSCIDHFALKAARPRSGLTRYIPSVLALALDPLCPSYAASLRERFPEAAQQWSALKVCALDRDLPHFDAKLTDASLDDAPTLARMSVVKRAAVAVR